MIFLVTAVLPDGTVTFLFSDIEGSTRMVHALGDAWPGVLARQREVCRGAWVEHGGHELATEGDSFFVVFAEAADGVAAAVDAQRRLAAGPWPDGVSVRVRMGLHTGAPVRLEDGYAGLDVHRGARVASAAHGGQVVLSAATVEAAGLTNSADLGWHQLKDLPDRTHLFQVVADGLDQEFPPIRSRGSLSGLPLTDGRIIGRDDEIAEVSRLLAEGARIVTLTGPGGSGKSRLATAVATEFADRYADGVYFVPLVGAAGSAEAWSEVGQVLGLSGDAREQVAGLAALLVLDNLEQLAGADDLARDLLHQAPGVVLVATSRRALHVEGEREVAVMPLGPAAGTELFVARSAPGRAVAPSVEVEELVRRLDGLPLAIEIAAARTRVLSPAALVARLDGLLDVVGHGADARQRTIRATIRWSYDLLDPVPQRVLECLGAFVDGASLPAVEAVTAGEDLEGLDLLDVLFELVDVNLVQVTDTDDGEPRFSLLETVRAFAVGQLDARGVREEREARHAQYFYEVARRHFADWLGPNLARNRAEYLRETGNLRAVVTRGARGIHDPDFYGDGTVPPGHVVALLATVAGVGLFQRWAECRTWVRAGLELPELDQLARAALLHELGASLSRTGEQREALVRLEDAAAIASLLGEVDVPVWVNPRSRLFLCCYEIAVAHLELGAFDLAWQAHERMLEVDPPRDLERILVHEVPYMISLHAGDLEAARTHLGRQEVLIVERGLKGERLVWVNNMSDLDAMAGRHFDARRRLAEHGEEFIAHGDLDLMQYVLDTFAMAIGPVNPALGARAYGASRRLIEDEEFTLSERNLEVTATYMGALRDALGPEAWAAELAIGRRTDPAEVLRTLAAATR